MVGSAKIFDIFSFFDRHPHRHPSEAIMDTGREHATSCRCKFPHLQRWLLIQTYALHTISPVPLLSTLVAVEQVIVVRRRWFAKPDHHYWSLLTSLGHATIYQKLLQLLTSWKQQSVFYSGVLHFCQTPSAPSKNIECFQQFAGVSQEN